VYVRRVEGLGIEEAVPALAGPVALLVVAAGHDPGSRGEQRGARREQVGLPGVPAEAPRAAAAVVPEPCRALVVAVGVVADVKHQVRILRRGGSCDGRERVRRIGAVRVRSLQLCQPLSLCRRQPVSPMTTILVGFALGTGSDWPATTALVVPEGSGYSHELTGNSAGLPGPPAAAPPMMAAALIPGAVFTVRAAMLVVAAARRFICTGVPPLIVMVGHGFAPASVGT
jgi:hypothetical protein